MTLKSIAMSACLFGLSSTSINAAVFTVFGEDYDITTITGSYLDNQALLESQPWWTGVSDRSTWDLAYEFARVVGYAFGEPNVSPVRGPLFAATGRSPSVDYPDGSVQYTFVWSFGNPPNEAVFSGQFGRAPLVFAVAERVAPVPLPAGGLLLLSGLGGIAALRRTKKTAGNL